MNVAGADQRDDRDAGRGRRRGSAARRAELPAASAGAVASNGVTGSPVLGRLDMLVGQGADADDERRPERDAGGADREDRPGPESAYEEARDERRDQRSDVLDRARATFAAVSSSGVAASDGRIEPWAGRVSVTDIEVSVAST